MKKYTNILNTITETFLGIFLFSIILISFFITNNLSQFVVKQSQKPIANVSGMFTYNDVFNPNIFSNDSISIIEAKLDVGGYALSIAIDTPKNDVNEKVITLYNNYNYKLKVAIILDILKLDDNSNYYVIVNDKENLVKDSYKPDRYDLSLELEPLQEANIAVKVKSVDSINTKFNLIFSEL